MKQILLLFLAFITIGTSVFATEELVNWQNQKPQAKDSDYYFENIIKKYPNKIELELTQALYNKEKWKDTQNIKYAYKTINILLKVREKLQKGLYDDCNRSDIIYIDFVIGSYSHIFGFYNYTVWALDREEYIKSLDILLDTKYEKQCYYLALWSAYSKLGNYKRATYFYKKLESLGNVDEFLNELQKL